MVFANFEKNKQILKLGWEMAGKKVGFFFNGTRIGRIFETENEYLILKLFSFVTVCV